MPAPAARHARRADFKNPTSWISSATALYASAGQAEAWWQRVVTPRYGSI